MFIWIVMHVNQLMFQPLDGEGRGVVQFFSFLELLVELVLIAVLIVALVVNMPQKNIIEND